MKNIIRVIALLFLVVTTVRADSWYSWYPMSLIRQEVCDYLNDKLKGHFDSQFEARALAIKKKYPKATSCQTTIWTVSIDTNDTSGSVQDLVNTIFGHADQAVNDIYFSKDNLKEVPVHRDFSCFLAHGQFNETVGDGDANGCIKFSSIANQDGISSVPVTAILGDPKTGAQRDTSGWTYAIGYRNDWHEELPTNPTRQEVCDYLNDKLQAHFDSQFEVQAQAIKDKYPNVTHCETILQQDFGTGWESGSSYQYPTNTIFDLADQVVNDLYNPKSNLNGTPARRTYSCLADRDSMVSMDNSIFGTGSPDANASIKFSPATNQDGIASIPVTAILGDPKTGSQRDTYGWRYVIGYLDDWHEELAINPTRQEVCDYINDKLKSHCDSQFEAQAQAIKDKYPNVTCCETECFINFKPLSSNSYGYGSGSFSNHTIFDLADQVVNNIYNPENKLGEISVHSTYFCLIEHNPKYRGLCNDIDTSDASIQFSPAGDEGGALGVPVTAMLSHPKTGLQRDTYGWTYAIEYQEVSQSPAP